MNDFDEFAEIALGIFVVLTLLIWVLTYLERTLVEPAREKRTRMGSRERRHRRSAAPPDDDRPG
jgi:hypothetical protein